MREHWREGGREGGNERLTRLERSERWKECVWARANKRLLVVLVSG